MATKFERLAEMFRNKPAEIPITFPAQAVAYMIKCRDEDGTYVPVAGEENEEPNTPDGVWACYLSTLSQPETPPVDENPV